VPERPSSLHIDLFSSDEHVRRVAEWRSAQVRRPKLDRRERELLAVAKVPAPEGWAVRVGLGTGARTEGLRGDLFLRRGLAERAVCPAAVWVADGDAVLAEHPIERVRLTSFPLLREDAIGVGFQGDPERRQFSWVDVRAAWREGDLALATGPGELVPLLRLRFGSRLTFELPGGA
jgi:hypothetical protein